MRIVAGAHRGRVLVAPKGHSTRPTADRARQAMFNVLDHAPWAPGLQGSRVLDLFAGSGALGLEAMSRGAARVTFVDTDRSARHAIDTNLRATGYLDRATVVATTAEVFLRRAIDERQSFSLVLLDPPYDVTDEQWGPILDLLTAVEGVAVVVLESSREPLVSPRWGVLRQKRYGGTLLTILQPVDAGPDASRTDESRADESPS